MRSPVAALSAVLALLLALVGSAAPAAADVDDFVFSSFEADYTLGRDEEGRSTLRTVERLTAEFPDIDQNRGIRRALVDDYQGAPTDLHVVSVTDGEGVPLDWESEEEEEFVLVTIASEDYVHGTHTYVITYEQRNITLPGLDGNPDEFYWDVNGTGWAQPFGRVTGRLHLDADLTASLTGDAACYVGREGSDDPCEITRQESGSSTVLVAEETDLGPGENLTLAVGFAAGTFVPRDDSLFASPFGVLLLLSLALVLGTVAAAVVFRATRLRDARGRPVIVPEYLPLAAPDLLVSAVLLRRPSRAVAAALVSLAVRGIVRIVEEKGKREKPLFTVQFAGMEGRPRLGSGPRGASGTERKLIRAFFGRPKLRERVRLDPRNTRLGTAVQAVLRDVRKDALDQGYQRLPPSGPRTLLGALAILGMVATLASAIVLLASALGGLVPLLALLLAPVGVLALVLPGRRPLTERGAEVRDYLLGVRDYLKLAEADRMRMLQSPGGALRGETEDGSVVHLYEQLLPHAVLFGVEKDWAEVLGTWYEREGSQPEWFAGPSAFHAGAFSSGISSLTASASTTYSSSSSSSSSGGSSGGGFSGGGGGGGGGGGV